MLQWREEARFSIFLYLVITSLSYQIIKGNLFKRIFLNVSLPISNVKEFTYTKGIVFGVFGEIPKTQDGKHFY